VLNIDNNRSIFHILVCLFFNLLDPAAVIHSRSFLFQKGYIFIRNMGFVSSAETNDIKDFPDSMFVKNSRLMGFK
jgi:hypothetical protein